MGETVSLTNPFPTQLYSSSSKHDDLPTRAKEVVSVGTLNVAHEAPYVPFKFQGEIWLHVLNHDARDVLTKAFAFNRVSQRVELGDLTKGTALERELASQANISDASHYYDPEFNAPTFGTLPSNTSDLVIIEEKMETPARPTRPALSDETPRPFTQVTHRVKRNLT